MVPLLKKNRRVVDKDTIKNWVQPNGVLRYVRLDFVSQVVVDRVSHVVWSKEIFETVLVDDLIFEYFHEYIQTPMILVCKETNLEHPVDTKLVVTWVLLIG